MVVPSARGDGGYPPAVSGRVYIGKGDSWTQEHRRGHWLDLSFPAKTPRHLPVERREPAQHYATMPLAPNPRSQSRRMPRWVILKKTKKSRKARKDALSLFHSHSCQCPGLIQRSPNFIKRRPKLLHSPFLHGLPVRHQTAGPTCAEFKLTMFCI